MSGPAIRIAVLRNPRATGNRGKPAPAEPDGVRIMMLDGLVTLDRQLAELARQGCDLLLIDGGDGTVREVVSRLFEAFADPPVLGILANGNTNLVARKMSRVPDLSAVRALSRAQLTELSTPRPILRIDRPGHPPIRGFIAGWAAYAAGTRLAVDEIQSRGQGQVWRAILTTLRRALFGAEAKALMRGVPGAFSPADAEALPHPRFLGIATVLEMPLIAGIAPFWGPRSGKIRWLDVHGSPRRLWLAAPMILVGRPMRWMEKAGYLSGSSDFLNLTIAGGIVVDGELIDTDPGCSMSLSAHETARFLSF